MSQFTKGEVVIKLLHGAGYTTASIQRVSKVSKTEVSIENVGVKYDPETGHELNPLIPGFAGQLVTLEESKEVAKFMYPEKKK